MVGDLLLFQRKFRCFAQVRQDQVIVDLNGLDAKVSAEAKHDLIGIIKFHYNGHEPEEVTLDSLQAEGGGLEDIVEEVTTRVITTNLRVGPNGAGINLHPEGLGMRIEKIERIPGQPDLRDQDLITRINEFTLCGTPEVVEEIFGMHFGDGVQISVKRDV